MQESLKTLFLPMGDIVNNSTKLYYLLMIGMEELKRLNFFAGFTGIDDPYEPPLNCEVCIYYIRKRMLTPAPIPMTYLTNISYSEESNKCDSLSFIYF